MSHCDTFVSEQVYSCNEDECHSAKWAKRLTAFLTGCCKDGHHLQSAGTSHDGERQVSTAEKYDFQATGPGCGVDVHPDSCLCDVKVPSPVSISPTPLAYSSYATRFAGCTPAEDFYEWAAWLLTISDEFKKRQFDVLLDIVGECRDLDQRIGVGNGTFQLGVERHALQRHAVTTMIGAGFGLMEIAHTLDLEPEAVAELYSNNRSVLPVLAWLRMEALLQDMTLTYTEIAEDVSLLAPCEVAKVRYHAQRMHLERDLRSAQNVFKDAALKAAFDKYVDNAKNTNQLTRLINEECGTAIGFATVQREIKRRKSA